MDRMARSQGVDSVDSLRTLAMALSAKCPASVMRWWRMLPFIDEVES